MTVQFPQIEAREPRLLGDNYKQNNFDRSFEEKLQQEKARLGLLFSPFTQLDQLFPLNFTPFANLENQENLSAATTTTAMETFLKKSPPSEKSSIPAQPGISLFDSVPLQSLNRQAIANLLYKTNWLVPNLSAQSSFYQAFLEGKLLTHLDLQSLIDQIVEQVRLVKDRGKTELSIGLRPAELGEIILTLSSAAGVVSIQIQAEVEAKKLIEAEIETLKKGLKKAGIQFDQIKVSEVTHA